MTSKKKRNQKVLESSNIKLSTVISDVFGVSGQKLLEHLMNEDYIDQEDVEQKIHGRMAHKKQLITDSLFGILNDHQLFLIKHSWMHIVNLEELISDIEKRIVVILSNYKEEVQLLITMPGIKEDTAVVIIAEIGVDMGQFPKSKHFASWARLSPGIHESARRKKH
ncbi:transposase [Heyndrickxia oleronia]|uniref:transposase n=1 Tax=Heyndrickxia oleronia TaxID=38875 RepID=UPI00203AE9C2|nr:transposase [Heyndrickxia oleronia]MCM3237999.1 transposase [Heyndrickxia oleronia]